MAQPRQLCVILSVDSFCAALMKISSGFSWSWSLLHQILGESNHGGRGAVWDVGEELGGHGMEEGSLQRRGEVRFNSALPPDLQVAPLAENVLGDPVSKSLSHG